MTDSVSDSLTDRVRRARDLAARRLVELQGPPGSWHMPIDVNGMIGATYVIMLRTTGLVEEDGGFETEARILRHMLTQVNEDGGFFKFPTSPSSRQVTRVCVTALRLASGEVQSGYRPAAWYRRNTTMDRVLATRLRRMLGDAEGFLRRPPPKTPRGFEMELRFLAPLLAAHADPSQRLPRLHPCHAAPAAWVIRSRRMAWLPRQFFYPSRGLWPAACILYARGGARTRPSRTRTQNAVGVLARRIRATQDPCGGWYPGAFYTALNVMALVEAGEPLDGPCIRSALSHLHHALVATQCGGAFLAGQSSEVANTGYALDSYTRTRRTAELDSVVGRAVAYLLEMQTEGGGFSWGNECCTGADADTTAHVLRAFPRIALHAGGAKRGRIANAVRRGVAFMLSRQNRDGGFSSYHRTFWPARARAATVLEQIVFDASPADVTGRIVEVLASAGYDPTHQSIRRALRFLLRMQCRNGAWWSRWWAGYLIGASFVLRAYGALGLRVDRPPADGDPLLSHTCSALARAVSFILAHQNADGGWGETIRADEHIRFAGQGPSTPLHTSHLVSTLLRLGLPATDNAVRRAMAYLLGAMSCDGRWHDDQVTFTIIAGCLYYRYEFLNYVLPLDALSDYLQAVGTDDFPEDQ